VEYRKAVSANAENPQAVYNLGCSMMMQQKDSVAIQYFERASKLETNKLRRAKSNHNIGVILQNHKMYDKAIEAYKQALRDNPNDDETRYNLALCKKLLKNNPDNNKQNKPHDKDINTHTGQKLNGTQHQIRQQGLRRNKHCTTLQYVVGSHHTLMYDRREEIFSNNEGKCIYNPESPFFFFVPAVGHRNIANNEVEKYPKHYKITSDDKQLNQFVGIIVISYSYMHSFHPFLDKICHRRHAPVLLIYGFMSFV
jgi:tetratricopeptide (TPR) repeat protein